MLELYVRMMNLLKREEGQGLVEYALIIVLVAVAVITALTLVGGNITATFQDIGGHLAAPGG
jgi:pilus assembly protein Flp/PilA